MKVRFTQSIQLENGRKLHLESVESKHYENEIKTCLKKQAFLGASEVFEGNDLITFRITIENRAVGFIFLKKAVQTVIFKSGDYILLFIVHPNYRNTGILRTCFPNFLRYFMGRVYSIKRYVAIANDKI